MLIQASSLQLPTIPEFVQHRIAIFDKIKAKREAEVAGSLLRGNPLSSLFRVLTIACL